MKALYLSSVLCISCGNPLLESGLYKLRATVISSDWSVSNGYEFEPSLWRIKENEGKYTMRRVGANWELRGKELEQSIYLAYEGSSNLMYNLIKASLVPNESGNRFTGDWCSEFSMNVSLCPFPSDIPECEPVPVRLLEHLELRGRLER